MGKDDLFLGAVRAGAVAATPVMAEDTFDRVAKRQAIARRSSPRQASTIGQVGDVALIRG